MQHLRLARWQHLPRARPGHLAHGRIAARARRPRWPRCAWRWRSATASIDTAEMYGEGGAEEIARRGAGRGAARGVATRRALRRQQGLSAQRQPRRAWSPPASAACAGCGWTASTCTCCTGAARPAGRHGGRIRATASSAAKIRALGREQLRCRRHAGAAGRAGRCGLRGQPGVLLARRARRRLRPAALAARASDAADGLLADRPRRAVAGEAAARWPSGWGHRQAQVALAWVMERPGVMAIPKSSDPRTCARTWSRRVARCPPRSWPHLTGGSRRRAQDGAGSRLNARHCSGAGARRPLRRECAGSATSSPPARRTTTPSDTATGILKTSISIIFVPMNTRITASP